MSKIYSAVDAEDAVHLIGTEVYFGDTLKDVKLHRNKCVLEGVRPEEFNYRFVVGDSNWNLIQEVEKLTYREIETIEEAKTFFGKIADNKDEATSFIVSYVYVQRGTVYIDGHPTSVLLAEYTIDSKPFGIEVTE